MSNTYFSGESIERTVPLLRPSDGTVISGVSITLTIIDSSNSNQLTTATFAINTADTSFTYKTEGANNTLGTTEMFGGRMVVARVTEADGDVYTLTDRYVLRQLQPFVIGSDLPCTIAEADIIASKTGATAFLALGEQAKEKALLNSYAIIKKMRLRECSINDGQPFKLFSCTGVSTFYSQLPDCIKDAIIRAAILTAEEEASCNSIESQIAAGILSTTSGSNTTLFRNNSPVEGPLPRAAMKALQGFLPTQSFAIGRA